MNGQTIDARRREYTRANRGRPGRPEVRRAILFGSYGEGPAGLLTQRR